MPILPRFDLTICCVLLTLAVSGCGGLLLDTETIMGRSTHGILPDGPAADGARAPRFAADHPGLPAQSPANVKVYTTFPDCAYCVLDTFYTTFTYDKDYTTYKKIERKRHLNKLRRRAGNGGANAILVVFDPKERHLGGSGNYDMLESKGSTPWGGVSNTSTYRDGMYDVVSSDKVTVVRVKTYAIFTAPD